MLSTSKFAIYEIHPSRRMTAQLPDTVSTTPRHGRSSLQLQSEALQRSLAAAREQLRECEHTVRKLKRRLIAAMDAERQLEFLHRRLRKYENDTEVRYLRVRVAELAYTVSQQTQRAQCAEQALSRCEVQLKDLEDRHREVEAELRERALEFDLVLRRVC